MAGPYNIVPMINSADEFPQGIRETLAESSEIEAAILDGINNSGSATLSSVADAARNPETEVYSAFLDIAESVSPAGVPYPYRAPSLSAPRPSVPVGTEVWWSVVSSDPLAVPVNAIAGDKIFVITPAPVPWTPLQDATTQVWFDPSATNVADGANVALWPDKTTHGYDATEWGIGSGQATVHPILDADGLGGTPCVTLPSRSGIQKNQTITPTEAVCIGVNAQFSSATTVMTLINMTASVLRYSFGKSTGGATWFIRSADGATEYTFGTADANPHSFFFVFTSTYIRAYIDGILVLDQVTTIALQPITSFRIGYVSNGSDNASWRLMSNGKVGDYFVATGHEPTSAEITVRNNWLRARRAA